MTLDFSNIYTNPFLCGFSGASLVELFSIILYLEDALNHNKISEVVNKYYVIITIFKFISLPVIGGVFVYFSTNFPGTPIFQFITGATSVGFLEKFTRKP